MNIKFIKAPEQKRNIKATIHKTGVMGFSSAAASKLNLDATQSLKIGVNTEDEYDSNLYVIIEEGVKEGNIKIKKAGKYFYANTKALFDDLKINFRDYNIIFDIVEFEYDGTKMYKFIKRSIARKKNKNNEI